MHPCKNSPGDALSFQERCCASSISVNDYDRAELKQISGPTKYYFARLPSSGENRRNPVISSLYEPLKFEEWLSPKENSFLNSLQSLRCRKAFSSFNIYPTTVSSLQVNELLWRVIRSGMYDPTEGDPLLGGHVFVLGIAPELHRFLSRVSLPELHRAIIDFLVLLHHQLTTDGDIEGLSKLQQDLVPHIWDELVDSIGIFPEGEPTDPYRSAILENIVQISFMTPWRVDVFAAYLSADDVTALADVMQSPNAELLSCLPVQLHNDNRRGTERIQGNVMLRLYQDWRVFAAVLRDGMGLPYDQVTEAMERAIHAGKSCGLLEQTFLVLEESQKKASYFSLLPPDLYERKIIPWLLRRGCEAIAPRRRRLASLKSLLELSSKYLEDLQLIEDLAPHLDSETAQVLVNMLDTNAEDPQGGAHATTSERVGLGIAANRVFSNWHAAEMMDSPQQASQGQAVGAALESSEVTPSRFSIATNWTYPLNNFIWEDPEAHVSREVDSDEHGAV